MSPRKQITYSQHPNHAARAAHAKGEKQFRTYDTSLIRPKRSPIPAILGIVVLVAAIVGIVFGVMQFMRGCTATNLLEEGQEVQVVVAEGEGAKSVAKTLVEVGLIANPNEFTDRLAQMGAENSLQPGTYTLVGGQSVDEIIAVLQTPVKPETFTVPEGSTMAQIADIVAKASGDRIKAEDFKKAAGNASKYADSYSFLDEAGKNSLEGFLFPKTYPINEDSTADSIIRAMLDQFGEETAGLDTSYPESQGLSFYDLVKMASLVEAESDAEHRATVASVFYNRLAAGMQLQADATVKYVVGHEPTAEDVATENEYNTYFNYGLTPTPIGSPSLDSFRAACNPEQTNYLYFYCEKDEKGNDVIYFSETYEEHQQTYQ